MFRLTPYLLFCLLLTLGSSARAETRVEIDEFAVSRWVTDNKEALKIPSIAVGIVGPEKPYYLEIYGPAELDDPFLIGSLTKSVTAMAVMLLVHDGALTLEDQASNWVRGVPQEVTVRHLLHQVSGLDRADGGTGWTDLDKTVEQMVADASWGPVGGSEFSYSNLNYQILGAIVERVSKQSYADFVRTRIFEPLDMKTATGDPAGPDNHVIGNQYIFGFPFERGEPAYNPVTVPSGFVWMSGRDMDKWLRVFVTRGKVDGKQVIPAEVVDALLEKPQDTRYAMGWVITSQYEPVKVGRHSGATGAFTSAMAVVPEREFGVFVLTNSNSWLALAPTTVLKGILAMILGGEKEAATNLEFIGRLIFGFVVAIILFTFLFELMRWLRAGFPVRLNRKELVAVVLTFVINIAVVIGVVVYFETPISVMIATQPDIGWGFLIAVGVGSIRRLLTGFNKTLAQNVLDG